MTDDASSPPPDTRDAFWSEFLGALHEDDRAAEADDAEREQRVDLRASLDRLAELDRRYRELVENLPLTAFVAEWDETLRLRYVSPQVEDLLGYSQERWLADPPLWQEILHPEDRERAMREASDAWSRCQPLACEYRLRTRDGHDVWVREETAVPPEGADRWVAHGVWVDVTAFREAKLALAEERERAEEYLTRLSDDPKADEEGRLAFYDALTGLPNRALIEDRLERAVSDAREQGGELVLLSIDLDAFRLVNDSLGHAAGDAVLCRAAARLRELVGPDDAIGRPGGDEFLMLLGAPGEDPDEAALAASERISDALEEPFVIEGAEFEVGATVGGSVFPRDARDADTLLKHADAAMYAAKDAGAGGFAVYTGGTLESFRRLSDTTRLRRALDNDELLLYYQPIYALAADGRVQGAEALIRWQHPDRGLVLPADFIPLAEETGLIEAIGEWVITAIGAQARTWLGAGLEPHISFNVSARQFRRRDLAELVSERLGAPPLDPSRFTMEITESAVMHDPDRALPLIGRLRELGLRLAIDDFGAGFSSLSRLRSMPVQELKIDRSLLRGTPEDPEAAGLVAAAIQLGTALGMEAVAEGVETEEQRRFLIEQDCAFAQGFHLARPMPATDVATLLPRAHGSG